MDENRGRPPRAGRKVTVRKPSPPAAPVDPLSGLPGRLSLLQAMADTITAHPAARFELLVVQILGFEEMSESLGAEVAELLLIIAGTRLRAVLGDTPELYRLRSTRFGVVLPNGDRDAAVSLGRELLDALSINMEIGEVPFHVEACFAVVSYPDHGDDAVSLERRSIVALTQAAATPYRYAVYREEWDAEQQHRFACWGKLSRALRRGDELALHYQPKIELANDRCTGVEALARWHHPRRGAVAPGDFIPLIEHSALRRPFLLWVLRTALAQATRWRRGGLALTVAVNISVWDLEEPDFARLVVDQVEAAGLQPADIELEVTETALTRSPARMRDTVHRLRHGGIRLVMDDFGTQHAAMAVLKDIAPHALKIDQSFIRHMHENARDAAMVRSAVQLARDLDLSVVAEGVETEAAYRMLQEMGCSHAQGYWIARPMPADALAAWVDQRNGRQGHSGAAGP